MVQQEFRILNNHSSTIGQGLQRSLYPKITISKGHCIQINLLCFGTSAGKSDRKGNLQPVSSLPFWQTSDSFGQQVRGVRRTNLPHCTNSNLESVLINCAIILTISVADSGIIRSTHLKIWACNLLFKNALILVEEQQRLRAGMIQVV